MKLLNTQFDGVKIEVPAELSLMGQCKVYIILDDGELSASGDGVATDKPKGNQSVWDIIKNNPNPKSDDYIRQRLQELRVDRDACD